MWVGHRRSRHRVRAITNGRPPASGLTSRDPRCGRSAYIARSGACHRRPRKYDGAVEQGIVDHTSSTDRQLPTNRPVVDGSTAGPRARRTRPAAADRCDSVEDEQMIDRPPTSKLWRGELELVRVDSGDDRGGDVDRGDEQRSRIGSGVGGGRMGEGECPSCHFDSVRHETGHPLSGLHAMIETCAPTDSCRSC
jgi:hypothetical protein